MKKLKKILLSTILGIVTIAGLSSVTNIVNAESAGPLYLGIIGLRNRIWIQYRCRCTR